METTLGKAHSNSPFTPLFFKYEMSYKVETVETKEETKEEIKTAPKEKKEKQPKAEKPKATPAIPQVELSEELQAW